MDKIDKALSRLSAKERQRIHQILLMIQERNFFGLDIKKLKGQQAIFRVRAGKYRIIFWLTAEKDIYILGLEKRSDTTYNKF